MKFKSLTLCIVCCLSINHVWAMKCGGRTSDDIVGARLEVSTQSSIPDLSNASPEEASQVVVEYVPQVIKYSFSRDSLYNSYQVFSNNGVTTISNPIWEIIKEFKINPREFPDSFEYILAVGKNAIDIECGNCSEMSAAGINFLYNAKYEGKVGLVTGSDHTLLEIQKRGYPSWMADSWTPSRVKAYPSSDWEAHFNGFEYTSPVINNIPDLEVRYGSLLPFSEHPDIELETTVVFDLGLLRFFRQS